MLALYEKTAKAVLNTVEKLNYMGLPLVRGDAWTSPALLAEALNHCESLRTLALGGTRLDDEGVAELAAGLEDGALPALEALIVGANRFGARGVGSLCGVFHRGVAPALQTLAASAVAATPIGASCGSADGQAVAWAAFVVVRRERRGRDGTRGCPPGRGSGMSRERLFQSDRPRGPGGTARCARGQARAAAGACAGGVWQMNMLPWSYWLMRRALGRGGRRVNSRWY